MIFPKCANFFSTFSNYFWNFSEFFIIIFAIFCDIFQNVGTLSKLSLIIFGIFSDYFLNIYVTFCKFFEAWELNGQRTMALHRLFMNEKQHISLEQKNLIHHNF